MKKISKEEIKQIPISEYFDKVLIELMPDYSDGTHRTELTSTPVACCPVHHESEPSFRYYEETNTFHCFGCGLSGDIINLHKAILTELRGSAPTFKETLNDLIRIFKNIDTKGSDYYKGIKKKFRSAVVEDHKHQVLFQIERLFSSSEELSVLEKVELITLHHLFEQANTVEQYKKVDTWLRLLNKGYILPSEIRKEMEKEKKRDGGVVLK